jgi:hypothetical protein
MKSEALKAIENAINAISPGRGLEMRQQPRTWQLEAEVDGWDKEIVITVDGNVNKIQAEKIFAIFYPNSSFAIHNVQVKQIV